MKNLPEENNSLENRLRAYSEAPPELAWKNIQSALASDNDATGVLWRDRTAAVAIIVFIAWFGLNNFSMPSSTIAKNNEPATTTSVEQKPNESSKQAGTMTSSPEKSTDVKMARSESAKGRNNNFSAGPNTNAQAPALSLSGLTAHSTSDDFTVAPSETNKNGSSIEGGVKLSSATVISLPSDADASANKIDSVVAAKKVRRDCVVVLNKIVATGKKRLPFTFYGMLSPSLSFLSITPKQNDSYIVQQFQNPSIMSTERLGLSFDAGIQGMITKRLGYVAGVSFYYQKQSYAYSGVRSDKTTFNEQTLRYDPLPFNQTLKYTMLNGGVQAGLMYTLIQSPLAHKIGVALQYQQGLYHSEGSYKNASSRYFNYQVFYRIELPLGSRTSFILQPSFIAPIETNESVSGPFSLKQFKAAIGLGFSYKIGGEAKLKTVRPNQSNR